MATKECPFCKSQIPAAASACKHCGKDVSTLHLVGKGMQSLGCLLTIFVTVPVLLLFLFAKGC
jgi:predicted amidophosphoribosyltransferase